jgi:hypothetical protein
LSIRPPIDIHISSTKRKNHFWHVTLQHVFSPLWQLIANHNSNILCGFRQMFGPIVRVAPFTIQTPTGDLHPARGFNAQGESTAIIPRNPYANHDIGLQLNISILDQLIFVIHVRSLEA